MKWWRQCQSRLGTSVPVKIRIWDQHSEVFCFQTFCILPVLLLDFSVAHGSKNNTDVTVSIARGLWLKTENTLKVYSYLSLSVNRSHLWLPSFSHDPQDPKTLKPWNSALLKACEGFPTWLWGIIRTHRGIAFLLYVQLVLCLLLAQSGWPV